MNKNKLIVICGPTASGKTTLAVRIAEELSINKSVRNNIFNKYADISNEIIAEIISADSRQIYRKMNIGTGKDLSEYKTEKYEIPYHCIDIRNPDEFFSLHDYLIECRKSLKIIENRRRIPVIAGGTGLYIESVLKAYKMDNIPPDYTLREELEKIDKQTLIIQLKNTDIEIYHKTDLSSKKRIIRAIEKALFYKNTDINTHSLSVEKDIIEHFNPVVLVTRWKRDELVDRIEKRLDQRFEEGMIDEVENLLEEGITKERMHFLGLEYRYITEYLKGNMNFDDMRKKLFTEIRRYSKRQVTYFKGMEKRGISLNYIDNADPEAAFKILESIK